MRIIMTFLCALLVLAGMPARADGPVRTAVVADGLDYPWSLTFLPGGDFLVTERGGRLWRIAPNGARTEITGLPGNIVARRQGGLFDVALHPDFARNNLVYLSYAGSESGKGGTGTEVLRATLRDNRLENPEIIFRAAPKMRSDVHFGGRLLFAPDGTLFITLGDRMQMDGAQDTATHWGGIVRLNDDGTVPADNPFLKTAGARPELYSVGHRNVQGIARAPDGKIWTHEHGPQGGDEVNILKPGANYGWPVITYGIDYDDSIISRETARDGMEQPVVHWTPSIAPSGMTFYDGDKFPEWRGDIFAGALAGAHLRHLAVRNDKITAQQELLTDMAERIRDVRTGPDGYIYILTDSADGKLIRVLPAR